MSEVKIWTCLFLSLVANIFGQRIECDWGYEYLCGDQCVGLDNSCMCGNETITLDDTLEWNCCNHGTSFKDGDGNVMCHGLKQGWRVPCNEICKQDAYWGDTTLSCQDKTQCVKAITLCRGVPICDE